MADGSHTLNIDAALADKLRAAAEAAGESLDAYARQVLEAATADCEAEWAEVDRIVDDAEANGDLIPWEEVLEWMQGWDGKSKTPFRPK